MYNDLHILVVGDIMLDLWREAEEYKMYQEAPVPDIHNPESLYTLGGAANVARILSELGVKPALLGVLGLTTPHANGKIVGICSELGIQLHFVEDTRGTTVKERIICHGQQVCRISIEDREPVSENTADQMLAAVKGIKFDGVIIADYGKGVMTAYFKRLLIKRFVAEKIPILVDPKTCFYGYRGCTIFKPNIREIDHEILDWKNKGWAHLCDIIGCCNLVVTSEAGMQYWDDRFVPAHKVDVANVSGAGDAAAAVMLCEYLQSREIDIAVRMANFAASQIVSTERTGHLDLERLEESRGELLNC